MKHSALQRLVTRLAAFETRRPWLVLALVVLSLVPSAWAVSTLRFRTAFQELLPDDKPSVIELRRVQQRLPSASTLTVVAESKDTQLLKRFVDELTPKLRKLDLVAAVDPGPADAQRFFEENKHLYASLASIEELHDEVVDAYDRQVIKKAGFDLGLEDDDDDDEKGATLDKTSIEKRFDDALADLRKAAPGMDGYYIGENGQLAAILVRTTLPSMDSRAYDLEAKISQLIAQGGYAKADPGFRHGYTGNLITSAEQYRVVNDDLIKIGASGVALVLLVVFLFFLRMRALLALGFSILVACIWSLAFARVSVTYLNLATGFLVSIIAGNGINAMVIWMARYLEARRDQGQDVAEAVRTASVETCEATLAVVGVAMVSYGALMTTDFRGFRHFGIIGGAGMLLCWIATYAVLPAIFVLSERFSPLPLQPTWRDKISGAYGRPFAWAAKRMPIPIAVIGIGLGLAGSVGSALYFLRDPMEYDLRNVLNEEQSPTSAGRLSSRVNKVVGKINQGGRAVLVNRIDQVKPLIKELERRRDSVPKSERPFGKVVSVYSLLPTDQEKKIELLTRVLDRVERAHERGYITDERMQEISKHIPKELRPIEIKDLPELVARPFQERNGDVGKVIYVSSAPGRSLNDAHYLMQWANSFRTVTLPDGEVIHGTGDAVVFSDMLLNIGEDAPRVAITSLVGTMLVILFAFRWRAAGWGALATLLLGVSWLVGALFAGGIKLNFLNFVALPVAIGAGADYAINIMKRREIEGPAGIERAFIETGGAVIACSMTTTCGYLALLLSINGAVRSFGLAAAIGEISTQLAAMLVLPAVLYWADARSKRGTVQPAAEGAADKAPG
jgi:predicted RND superfamily exporter protein